MPPAQSYWQQVRKRQEFVARLALPLFILAIIGSRFYVPMGLVLYFAAWCFAYRIQDQMHPRWELVQGTREAFKHPPVGLSGSPGESKGLGALFPPNRVASINALIIAVLFAVIVPQAMPVISGIGVYAMIVALAQARRLEGYQDTPYEPLLFSKDEVIATVLPAEGDEDEKDISKTVIIGMIFVWGGVAVSGLLYLAEHFGRLWIPTKTQIRWFGYAHIDLHHFHIGYSPIYVFIIVGLISGVLAAWWAVCMFMLRNTREPWKKQQDIAQEWSARWESIGKIPDVPIYRGEVNKPSDTNHTHTVVIFQTPQGTDFSQFEDLGDRLASSLQPDIVLVAPLPMQDEMGMPIPGTAQTLGFKVMYAAGNMGERPWMRNDLDDETIGFVFQWAVKRTLAGMRLPSPIWAYNRMLYKDTSKKDMMIMETQWRLPPGLPYDELTRRIGTLQDKLEVPWLRVGRRPNGKFVSIVYGADPMEIRDALEKEVPPSTLTFLDSINWDYILRACKITNQEGQVPPYLGTRNANQGLKVHSFGAISGLPITTVQMAKAALVPTLRIQFVDIDPSDDVGGFRIITGDQDPLDRVYKFADYIHDEDAPLIVAPSDEPDISFKVGVGADGKLINFAHDNESPHLIIAGASGQGKSLDCSLPVAKTDGSYTTMGDIEVGDEIYDQDGNPTRVTHVYPIDQSPEECYEIVFRTGGRDIRMLASSDHRWLTEDLEARSQPESPYARDQLVDLAHRIQTVFGDLQNHEIQQIVRGIYDENGHLLSRGDPTNDQPDPSETIARVIHPYAMGVWLASVHRGAHRVLTAKHDVGSRLEHLGYRVIGHGRADGRYVWEVPDLEELASAAGINSLPMWYLDRASAYQRLMLVRGMVDTMGRQATLERSIASDVIKMLTGIGMDVRSGSRGTLRFDNMNLPRPEAESRIPVLAPFSLGAWLATSGNRAEIRHLDHGVRYRMLLEGVYPVKDNSKRGYDLVGMRHTLRDIVSSSVGQTLRWVSEQPPEYRRDFLDGFLHLFRPDAPHANELASRLNRSGPEGVPEGVVGMLSGQEGTPDLGRMRRITAEDVSAGLYDRDGSPLATPAGIAERLPDHAGNIHEICRSVAGADRYDIRLADGSPVSLFPVRLVLNRLASHVISNSAHTARVVNTREIHRSLYVGSTPNHAVRMATGLTGGEQYAYVVGCERVPPVPMRCIEVDSPSHTYLVGHDLIPTHNSNLIHSMVLQIASKNTPTQWELRIAEPKNELQRYRGLAHVTRFVDMHTPADNHYQPVMNMLEELYQEMERRYALFLRLPTRPHKLEQALRDPALDEPLPYITCLIEECADYFAKPDSAAERQDYNRLIYYLNWLVRKARGAGIYIVAATQRPNKENIPAQVKANSRRIGLGTQTMVDSQIIIDQPGLEEIRTKGRGMVSSYGGYKGFRAFYFDERPGDYNSLSRFLDPLEILSGDRILGPTSEHSVKYPVKQ